jgi:hypothetical protein
VTLLRQHLHPRSRILDCLFRLAQSRGSRHPLLG